MLESRMLHKIPPALEAFYGLKCQPTSTNCRRKKNATLKPWFAISCLKKLCGLLQPSYICIAKTINISLPCLINWLRLIVTGLLCLMRVGNQKKIWRFIVHIFILIPMDVMLNPISHKSSKKLDGPRNSTFYKKSIIFRGFMVLSVSIEKRTECKNVSLFKEPHGIRVLCRRF